MDVPAMEIDFLEGDGLVFKTVGEKHGVAAPAKGAVALDSTQLGSDGVLELGELAGEGPRRRSVDARGRDLPEGFVRPLVVVSLTEAVEGALLAGEVDLGR
jgi:hypothetical protein